MQKQPTNISISQKQSLPPNLPKKQRSPYALQYLQFERRLQNRKPCKLPSLRSRNKNYSLKDNMNGKQYLEMVKHLRSKPGAEIWIEEGKENQNKQSEDSYEEEMTQIKGLIDRMKFRRVSRPHSNKSNKTDLTRMQQSQLVKDNLSKQQSMQLSSNTRSRAFSNALAPLREVDQNAGIKFLEYKKGKKELPNWLKYD